MYVNMFSAFTHIQLCTRRIAVPRSLLHQILMHVSTRSVRMTTVSVAGNDRRRQQGGGGKNSGAEENVECATPLARCQLILFGTLQHLELLMGSD